LCGNSDRSRMQFLFTDCGTYLFSFVVIPHGPGRTAQGTSAPGCTSLASDGYAHIPLGAAQLVCSQLFECLTKGLAFFHTFHFGWYFSFFCIPRSEDPRPPALLCSVPGSRRLPRLPQPGRLEDNRTKVGGKKCPVSSCSRTD
jgi:hypothetical protein